MGIHKVTVVGLGTMGASIGAHIANSGLIAYGVDMVPTARDLPPGQEHDFSDPHVRNFLGRRGVNAVSNAKRSGFYLPQLADGVTIGNVDDNLESFVADSDLVIEAVFEDPVVKQDIHKRIEKARRPDTIVASNTSGLPIDVITEGRSDDFRRHFLNMHWMNPPRDMELIELIAGIGTDPAVMRTIERFCYDTLGKVVVHAKDVPGFATNRVGPFPIALLLNKYQPEHGIATLDYIFGPHSGSSGKPFVTSDLVGLRTLVNVMDNIRERVPSDDAASQWYTAPTFVRDMVKRGNVAGISGRPGFYAGKDRIVNPETLEYDQKLDVSIEVVEEAKKLHKKGDTAGAIRALYLDRSIVGDIFRDVTNRWIRYAAQMVPEVTISGSPADIDVAMRRGYNQMGPFEKADAIGIDTVVALLEEDGDVPDLLLKARERGGMYKEGSDGKLRYVDLGGTRREVKHPPKIIVPEIAIKKGRFFGGNDSAVVHDLGDKVLGLRITSYNGTIDNDVIAMTERALQRAARDHAGLVIYGQHEAPYAPMAMFSAGANLELLIGLNQWYLYGTDAQKVKAEQLINDMVARFQKMNYDIKFSPVPVVVAKAGIALGGGLEVGYGGNHRVHREMIMGLVEAGAGLIPGGGGTTQTTVMLYDRMSEGGSKKIDPFEYIRQAAIMMGNPRSYMSSSALHAQELGYLKPTDGITALKGRLLYDAKGDVIRLAESGYQPPQERSIELDGQRSRDRLNLVIDMFQAAGQVSNTYMRKVMDTLGWVLTGGDEGAPGTYFTERQMLDVERAGFMRLALSGPGDNMMDDPGFAGVACVGGLGMNIKDMMGIMGRIQKCQENTAHLVGAK